MNATPSPWILALGFVLTGTSCSDESARALGVIDISASVTPETLVLLPHPGDGAVDLRIRQRQDKVRKSARSARVPHLERLGSLFVAKARRSHDAGYYKLAEQCAMCIEKIEPDSASAMLLRGHVRHSLHDFAAAEELARALVGKRGGFLDHGLLGDVLLDRGELEAALASYQKMLNLRPCLQSYTRAAHVRHLRGDVVGARRLLTMATRAGSPRDPESLAWTLARLAQVELQAEQLQAARAACDSALALLPGYAPALLILGRVQWADGERDVAVATLHRAVARNPLPEYRWHLIEMLRELGHVEQVTRIQEDLRRTGEQDDPRTFALFLLASRIDGARALAIAEREIVARQDALTVDTHAWALFRNGRKREAWNTAQRALAHGTEDARVFYHAGAIALGMGEKQRGANLLRRAQSMRQMLMPSERGDLVKLIAAL